MNQSFPEVPLTFNCLWNVILQVILTFSASKVMFNSKATMVSTCINILTLKKKKSDPKIGLWQWSRVTILKPLEGHVPNTLTLYEYGNSSFILELLNLFFFLVFYQLQKTSSILNVRSLKFFLLTKEVSLLEFPQLKLLSIKRAQISDITHVPFSTVSLLAGSLPLICQNTIQESFPLFLSYAIFPFNSG